MVEKKFPSNAISNRLIISSRATQKDILTAKNIGVSSLTPFVKTKTSDL